MVLKKMVKINDMQRRSGKTTQAIKRLMADSSLLLIVSSNKVKDRIISDVAITRNLQDYLDLHIITFNEVLNDGIQPRLHWLATTPLTKILIDEGLNLEYDKMFNIMYQLGSIGIPVEVYGSTHVYTDAFDQMARNQRLTTSTATQVFRAKDW